MKFLICPFLVVMGKKEEIRKRLFPESLSSTTSTRNASPSPARDSSTWRAALHASEALLAAINSSLSDD